MHRLEVTGVSIIQMMHLPPPCGNILIKYFLRIL